MSDGCAECGAPEGVHNASCSISIRSSVRIRAALLRLANEVRATMSLAEHAVRESAGNTNYQCLMDAESEARVALGAANQQRQDMPK